MCLLRVWLCVFFTLAIADDINLGERFHIVTQFRNDSALMFTYDSSRICHVKLYDQQEIVEVGLSNPWTFEASYPQNFTIDQRNLRLDGCFIHRDGYSYLWAYDTIHHITTLIQGHQLDFFYADRYDMSSYDYVDGSIYLAKDGYLVQHNFDELIKAWTSNLPMNTLTPLRNISLPQVHDGSSFTATRLKVTDGQPFYSTNIGLFTTCEQGRWNLVKFAQNQTLSYLRRMQSLSFLAKLFTVYLLLSFIAST